MSCLPYMQNRELSWLTFNERVLDQGIDPTVPLLNRLTFVSIFSSNLQEFFMVRVGSLTDLMLLKNTVRDNKTNMSPEEQIDAINRRCHELYPIQESIFEDLKVKLSKEGVTHVRQNELTSEQKTYLREYLADNVVPFLSPQIINTRHPFPHLANGDLYVLVRLMGCTNGRKASKEEKAKYKNGGAEGATFGLIPLPRQCKRIIKLPGSGFQFILLEHAIELIAPEIFSMYQTKHTNIVCVTRNADLSDEEGSDEVDEDYREHMKRILKLRARLAPVRLECEKTLSPTMKDFLLEHLKLTNEQVYTTKVPLDMSYAWELSSYLPEEQKTKLTSPPQQPQWPSCLDKKQSIMDQIAKHDILVSYPYESMDSFVQLLREAAQDPNVASIKITLYRLAHHSQLAEALIEAAENGKEVTALFELRARFDESNNIEWSQRFEQAGCKVIYGFRDYKVHSKICCITRQTPQGVQHITQLGTGNYNESTAKLYTDLSYMTANKEIGDDAILFFRNMGLENVSDSYQTLYVAPLQIKPLICEKIDEQIKRAHQGLPAECFFKTNSITDKDIIEKIVEGSQAGVKFMLLVRGISCILPGIKGYTENVRVVSIVGRLLEHSRIYSFGPKENRSIYLSSADLMTRNMDKRVEICWPLVDSSIKKEVEDFIDISLRDTAKLRELLPDATYTPLKTTLSSKQNLGPQLFNSQDYLSKIAKENLEEIAPLKRENKKQATYQKNPSSSTPGLDRLTFCLQQTAEALIHLKNSPESKDYQSALAVCEQALNRSIDSLNEAATLLKENNKNAGKNQQESPKPLNSDVIEVQPIIFPQKKQNPIQKLIRSLFKRF